MFAPYSALKVAPSTNLGADSQFLCPPDTGQTVRLLGELGRVPPPDHHPFESQIATFGASVASHVRWRSQPLYRGGHGSRGCTSWRDRQAYPRQAGRPRRARACQGGTAHPAVAAPRTRSAGKGPAAHRGVEPAPCRGVPRAEAG
uniref:Predicted glutamine synthetase n=1 Tax=uncultured bacterium MedeBAC46A06 TaxID=332275 RepID=Q4PJH3_9BACT|nr:predicted glutamine synthetase [uncultured bacterium MedeBAC46A06]